MGVVEKAGSNILKASFPAKDKKKKKDKKKDAEFTPEAARPDAKPVAVDLDFERLASLGYYDSENRSSQLALELRAVKRRLLRRIGYLRASGERQAFRTPGRQRNIILVTSTRAGEGKTFTAVNLALSLAIEDKIETLLIDADLARPKIRDRLALPFAAGLSNRLLDPALDAGALGWRLRNEPLSILPEGAGADRPADLFARGEAQRLLSDLATARPDRLVIIDAPPVLAATDAVVLAKFVDEIVFVVEANSTPEAAVAAAVDELIDVNPNVSLMLNRCQIGSGGAHYGSYEYYGRDEEASAPAQKSNEG